MFATYLLSTIFFSYYYFYFLSKKLNIDNFIFNIFFTLKFVFLLFYIYSHFNNFGTDALSYYTQSHKYNSALLPISENLIYGINYFFKKIYSIEFESLNIITFFISFMSSLLLLSLIKDADRFSKIAICITLLLPSLNFFTSGLNKDMLIFFSLSLFLYSLLNKRHYLLILSVILAFLVRPYVCFAILLSFIICAIFLFLKKSIIDRQINLKKFILYFLITIVSLFITYFILDNLLGSFGKYFLVGNIEGILSNLQSHYTDTNLGIPYDTNTFFRLINYAFFPTVWHLVEFNIFYVILIIENTFLLFIFISFIYNFKFSNIDSHYKLIAIITFLILYFILALVTSNYGIALRQKWMVLPFLLIIFSRKAK